MSIRAHEGLTREWYTPVNEVDQDDAAEFELKPLTGPELLEVQGHYDQEKLIVKGAGLVMACKFGLVGWKNIIGEDDKEKVFTRQGYNRLPGDIIAELGGRVIKISTLSADEAKN